MIGKFTSKGMTIEESRKNFLDKAKIARESLYHLLIAYEYLDYEDNGSTAEKYPFDGSFDEWICEYDTWIETLENNWFIENKKYYPTLTVGDLKKVLEKIEDDTTHVVIRDDKNDWWLNIESLEIPRGEELFTLTFYPKDNFDNRQF